MNKSQIIAFSINILKSISRTLITDIQFLKINSYLLYEKKLLLNLSDPIKKFTLALYGLGLRSAQSGFGLAKTETETNFRYRY
jgi:hypothetical protein